jgi:hypothetical protein
MRAIIVADYAAKIAAALRDARLLRLNRNGRTRRNPS